MSSDLDDQWLYGGNTGKALPRINVLESKCLAFFYFKRGV